MIRSFKQLMVLSNYNGPNAKENHTPMPEYLEYGVGTYDAEKMMTFSLHQSKFKAMGEPDTLNIVVTVG